MQRITHLQSPQFMVIERSLQAAIPAIQQDHTLPEDWRLYWTGWAWLRAEQAHQAQAFFTLAQQKASDPHLELHCQRALALAEIALGRGSAVVGVLESLVTAYHQANDSVEACFTHIHLLGLYNFLGRTERVLQEGEWLRRSPALDDNTFEKGRLQRVLGIAHSYRGHLEIATQELSDVHTYFDPVTTPVEWIKSRFEQAFLASQLGDFTKALTTLQLLLPILEQLGLPLQRGFAMKLFGTIAGTLGRYDLAVLAAWHAQQLFKAAQREDQVANCDLNIGVIAYYYGLYPQSIQRYQRAEAIDQRLDRRRLLWMNRRNQAMAWQALGENVTALQILHEIATMLKATPELSEHAETCMVMARTWWQMDDLQQAHSLIAEAIELFERNGDLVAAAEARLERGFIYLDQHDIVMADSLIKAALPYLSDQPHLIWRARYGLMQCYRARNQPMIALDHAVAGCQALAILRCISSEHESSRLFGMSGQLFVDSLELALASGDLDSAWTIIELQRAVTLRHRLLHTEQQPRNPAHIPILSAILHDPDLEDSLTSSMLQIDLQQLLVALQQQDIMQAHHWQPSAIRHQITLVYGQDWLGLSYSLHSETLTIMVIGPEGTSFYQTAYNPALDTLVQRAIQSAYRLHTYVLPAVSDDWPVLPSVLV